MKSIKFYWNKVWGLGIAGDRWCCVDPIVRPNQYRMMLEVKIFILPLMICAMFPVWRWTKDKLHENAKHEH